jgi:hypothetical protein
MISVTDDPIKLPVGLYVVSAEKSGMKPFSVVAQINAGETATVSDEVNVPGIDITAGLPDWDKRKEGRLILGKAVHQSVNPLFAETVALTAAIADLVMNATQQAANVTTRSYESTDSKERQSVVESVSNGLVNKEGFKVSVPMVWRLSDNRVAVAVHEYGVKRTNATSTVGVGNLIAFHGAENRCSAQLAGLVFESFKMFSLSSGVDISAMSRSFSNSSLIGEKGVEERLNTSVARLTFNTEQKLKKAVISIVGQFKNYEMVSGIGDKIDSEEMFQSAIRLLTTIDGKLIRVNMMNGTILSVDGVDVCTATTLISNALQSSGYSVSINELPDTLFGTSSSEVSLRRR